MWVLGCNNSTLQYNVVHSTIISDFDSEEFGCDWGNGGYCLIEYNYRHDNAGGMFLNCDGCSRTSQVQSKWFPTILSRMIAVSTQMAMRRNCTFINNVVYCPDKDFDITVPLTTYFTSNFFVGAANSTLPTGSGIVWYWNVFQTVMRPTDSGLCVIPDSIISS